MAVARRVQRPANSIAIEREYSHVVTLAAHWRIPCDTIRKPNLLVIRGCCGCCCSHTIPIRTTRLVVRRANTWDEHSCVDWRVGGPVDRPVGPGSDRPPYFRVACCCHKRELDFVHGTNWYIAVVVVVRARVVNLGCST